MFKKKPKTDDLQARLRNAEDHLEALRAEAVAVASSDPDKLAALSEQGFRLEFEINALTEALRQVEVERAEAEALACREADKLQRQQTCGELHKLADGLEKAVAPVPDALKTLHWATLARKFPSAIEIFISELRAGAELFRNRGASGDGALIEHQYLETGHRQIGGANKTVVATTDEDHIVHHPPFHKP